MIPASDRYVSKSDNGCPDDEPAPKKAHRYVEPELRHYAKRAADLIAKALQVSARRVLKARSGDDALSVRRAVLYYLQGKDYQIWMLKEIFGLDRGVIADDLTFIRNLVADDEEFDAMMDDLIEGTDRYMCVDSGAFINICLAELEAARAAAQAIQTIRQARKTHEKALEPKPSVPEAVLKACENLPEDLRKKVLDKWTSTPRKAA
jgi:hypothetical protein